MQSMTGFASAQGASGARQWRWEAKSVNGRGLDLRFRIGDGFDIPDAALRSILSESVKRGSITIFLKSDGGGDAEALRFNAAAFRTIAAAAVEAEEIAQETGLTLAAATVGDLFQIRGVIESGGGDTADADQAALMEALTASFRELVASLVAARGEEGARLADTLTTLVDEIERLVDVSAAAFQETQGGAPGRLAERVNALLEAGADVPAERLAQELAMLAVKADVREELDRLTAHIAAARKLIATKGPIGRKLDFLTQEFNREANTLCSKSGSTALTQAGLDLKVTIDQLREQAQNVE